jgi:Mn-dependent DtxR family transcriptional regulator
MITQVQPALTPPRRAALLAIADLLENRNFPPTFEEVGNASGLSFQSAAFQIRALEGIGLISRQGRRTIQLTATGQNLVKAMRRSKNRKGQ